MFWLPHRNEAMALRLEDVASTLDAGLGAEAVLESLRPGAGPAAADLGDGLVQGMVARGLRLEPTEIRVLSAAESGGALPAALRARAAARRARAELGRDLLARLRYPALLVVASAAVAVLAGSVLSGSRWAVLLALALPALLLAGAVLGWRLVQRPSFSGAGIPGLQPLLRDAAEIPYLEALGGLYGAGVPIVEAHDEALRAVPVAWVRARLFAAARILAEDPAALTEVLARTGSLCPETLQILLPAERAGQLEDAIGRALARRRHTLALRAGRAVRLLGAVVYGVVVLVVAAIVIDFYSGLYGGRWRR